MNDRPDLAAVGWVVEWSRVVEAEVLFVRDLDVAVPVEYAGLPRFDQAELAVLAADHPSIERLRAIYDVKREMPGARVIADSGEPLAPARQVFPTEVHAERRGEAEAPVQGRLEERAKVRRAT